MGLGFRIQGFVEIPGPPQFATPGIRVRSVLGVQGSRMTGSISPYDKDPIFGPRVRRPFFLSFSGPGSLFCPSRKTPPFYLRPSPGVHIFEPSRGSQGVHLVVGREKEPEPQNRKNKQPPPPPPSTNPEQPQTLKTQMCRSKAWAPPQN